VLSFVLVLGRGRRARRPPRPTERSKQKAQAEASRAGMQQKLKALKRDIGRPKAPAKTRPTRWPSPRRRFRTPTAQLRELAGEQAHTNARLQALDAEREQLAATIERKRSSWPSCCASTTWPATKTASSCCCRATIRTASTATCN
jgi:hypothetical protein